MCGIAGLYSAGTRHSELRERVLAMSNSVRHRGPDGEGIYLSDQAPLALAHRRLSIIDLSDLGAQPMVSRSGSWVVAFNGEIYNYVELRARLLAAGSVFQGRSDTEVLTEYLDRYGLDVALRDANGMFAIAAWNVRERQLHLVRDRFGEKPLYVYSSETLVAFASDISAIRSLPNLELSIDAEAAASMLRWSFIPHPRTIYKGVTQVSPGEVMTVREASGAIECLPRTWWSVTKSVDHLRSSPPADHEPPVDALTRLLSESVAIRLRSDVPVGTFLSGGIDSSVVAALAQRQSRGHNHKTITVSMPDLGFDEAPHAAAVARFLGTDHREIQLTSKDATAMVPDLPRLWTEPFGDPSSLPTALLCKVASSEVRVCLSGDGGDEMFAGYNRHAVGVRLAQVRERMPRAVSQLLARTLSPESAHRLETLGQRLPGSARIPDLSNKLLKLSGGLEHTTDLWSHLASNWPDAALLPTPIQPARPQLSGRHDALDDLVLADLVATLPDQMLVKVDRASMAYALEVRVPLLDKNIFDWMWARPSRENLSGLTGKMHLRKVAYRLLPESLLNRPKMGFDPPLAKWLRGDLRDWSMDLLANPRCVSEGWLDGTALSSTVTEHFRGDRDWTYRLWTVLMLEAWLREHHR